MNEGPWLPLLLRQSGPGFQPSWDDLVVGYDFGLLTDLDIQGWLRAQPGAGPACDALVELAGEGLAGFERALWAAAAEATGKVPRPGGQRWARAQDRWRVALLKDAMASPVSPEALAVLVEAIYERVGCPEDMLGLWGRPTGKQGWADRDKVADFIRRTEWDGIPAA